MSADESVRLTSKPEHDMIATQTIKPCRCGSTMWMCERIAVTHYATIDALRRERDEARAQWGRVLGLLKDGAAVHMNILRGDIVLSRINALHIAGATDYDDLRATIASQQKQIEWAMERIHPWYGECDAIREDGGCTECHRLRNTWENGDDMVCRLRVERDTATATVREQQKQIEELRAKLQRTDWFEVVDSMLEARDEFCERITPMLGLKDFDFDADGGYETLSARIIRVDEWRPVMPYFPVRIREEAPYKCQGCGGWFYRGNVSCCVMHAEGTCCHMGETPTLAPHSRPKRTNELTKER